MAAEFDPYLQWLGISPQYRPLNFYRLLGVEPFEHDPRVIENAARRAAARLHDTPPGEHDELAERITGEIKRARQCLLDPKTRSAYDRALKADSPQRDQQPRKPAVRKPAIRRPAAAASAPDVPRPVVTGESGPVALLTPSGADPHRRTSARRRKPKQDMLRVCALLGVLACGAAALLYKVMTQPNDQPAIVNGEKTKKSDGGLPKAPKAPEVSQRQYEPRVRQVPTPRPVQTPAGPQLDPIDSPADPKPAARPDRFKPLPPPATPTDEQPPANPSKDTNLKAKEHWNAAQRALAKKDIPELISHLIEYRLIGEVAHKAEAEQLHKEANATQFKKAQLMDFLSRLNDRNLDFLEKDQLTIHLDFVFKNLMLSKMFHDSLRKHLPEERKRRAAAAKP